MAYMIQEQKIQINILDADTNQIIQKNFLRDTEGSFVEYHLVEVFKDGTGYATVGYAFQNEHYEATIKFIESQITAIGYDYNSITGNVISPVLDPDTGFYLYPWVVNVYMRKL